MKEWLLILLVCWAIYEIVEHLIIPVFWLIRYRKRNPAFSPSGMIGKRCIVKQWNGTSGKVWIGTELWNARSKSPMIPGAEAVVQDMKGLTLLISSLEVVPQSSKSSSATP